MEEKHTLILGAMDEEIQALLDRMTNVETTRWLTWELYLGMLEGRSVIVSKSGIGKVFSAMITQHLLDTYAIEQVLFTGVAGGINRALKIGDIVLGERLIHHDLDVSALGFKIGHIPFTNFRYFEGDKALLEHASLVSMEAVQIVRGCIGTGDQFVTDPSKLEGLELDCVDMEGCSVAQVCTLNHVPFLVIRILSDSANDEADQDFSKNLPIFAHRSLKLIEAVLNR